MRDASTCETQPRDSLIGATKRSTDAFLVHTKLSVRDSDAVAGVFNGFLDLTGASHAARRALHGDSMAGTAAGSSVAGWPHALNCSGRTNVSMLEMRPSGASVMTVMHTAT